MSLSSVDIGNMALGHIGARQTIESFSEQSAEARTVALWYDRARELVLEKHDWGFARKRQALAPSSEPAPTPDWQFRYQYPSDCLKARALVNPGIVYYPPHMEFARIGHLIRPDAIPYEVGLSTDKSAKIILTDLDQAELVYTANLTDPTLYPMSVVFTISYALASMIAYKITGRAGLQQELYRQFLYSFDHAAADDGNESIDRPPRDAEWIRGRL